MPAALLLVDVQYDFLPPSGALAVQGGDEILPVVCRLVDEGDWALVVASQDFHPPAHISFHTTHSLPAFSSTTVRDPRTGKSKEQELWPVHCVQGTRGCEVEEGVRARMERRRRAGARCEVVTKGADVDLDAYSAFAAPLAHEPTSAPSPLTQLLLDAKVDTLVVAGLATDFCVRHSVLDALALPWASPSPSSASSSPRSAGQAPPIETKPDPDPEPTRRVLVVRSAVRGVDPAASAAALRELEHAGAVVVEGVEAALRAAGAGAQTRGA
ncbi:Isochorismatase hydrolase [Rhodotorula diobovata]|uniref:nicotinamidase n=1 Tax=Rhodotorula diobovata TaxID=5288 RepID=A0A5C5FUZ0_9BASI|nr:Isochorismatase hydrolase [Rhodotorula diobovata]